MGKVLKDEVVVGVVSDSHNDLANLDKAVKRIFGEHKADMIAHLGDDYSDTKKMDVDEDRLLRVPGVYSEFYHMSGIEKRFVREINSWRLLLTHTPSFHQNDPADTPPPEVYIKKGLVDVVLFGHTHKPSIERDDNGIVWFNPGHIIEHDRRGFLPSFGILKITSQSVEAGVFELADGHLFMYEKYEKL